jgi:acyl-homoserine lactone acylase PvdQ
LSRTEERKALALAREFKLEDKILDLPYAQQRKALELINAGLEGKKLRAEIAKLEAEAGGSPLDASTAKALDDIFTTSVKSVIPNLFMEGVPLNSTVNRAVNKAKEEARDIYTAGNEDATAAAAHFDKRMQQLREASKKNPALFGLDK